jgi:16S rRNA (guanine1207-N2)-methyltransferase
VDAEVAALGWALSALPARPAQALYWNARPGLQRPAELALQCQQDFLPWASDLRAEGCAVLEAPADWNGRSGALPPGSQALILLLPARQREAARAEAARCLQALAPGGRLLAACANDQGARALESDLRQLCPALEVQSKHKCRLLLARAENVEAEACAAWASLDDARPIDAGGLIGRVLLGAPGLFAVDRIDAGSALLIEHLPPTLSGAVADLGSGLGVLSAAALERCPGVASLDLYEASARAVALSRHSLVDARIPVRVHRCDVCGGIEGGFDAVLCNPPFHAGARADTAIGQAFIRSAAACLKPGGEAWIVANAHLPYEAVLAERFGQVAVVAQGQGFKLFRTRR